MKCIPQGNRTLSPHEMITGKRPDLSKLCAFGYRCYAIPTDARPSALETNTRVGIFLGYRGTFSHPMYYDLDTKHVKTAGHITLDESPGFDDHKPPCMKMFEHENLISDDLPTETFDP
jgi:hypothetical protein